MTKLEQLLDSFENLNLSNSENNSVQNPEMAEINYSLLRYQADNIPNFDGNPKLLQRFITSSENLLRAFQDKVHPDAPINTCLIDTIFSKLRGRAADLICSRSEIDNWQLIKNLLQTTFADQRSIDCLIQDLLNLRINRNESPINFGMRLQDTRSLLFSKLNASSDNRAVKLMKIDHYNDFALKTFINNLPYNTQLVVRLKNPESLEQAISFVQEEDNFQQFKFRNTNNTQFSQKPVRSICPQTTLPQTSYFTPQNTHNNYKPPQTFNQPTFTNTNIPQFPPRFPQGPIPITPKPNYTQSFPTNKQVFGKPQNVFKPGTVQPTYKPTPMSTSTRNSMPFKKPNYFQNNPNQKPNFTHQELFNQEVTEQINFENPFEQTDLNYDYTANQSSENDVHYDYTANQSLQSNLQDDTVHHYNTEFNYNPSNSNEYENYQSAGLYQQETFKSNDNIQHQDFLRDLRTENST